MDIDWKKTLSTVAPALATALGSPVAGVAVSMACKALGLSETSEDALAAAVGAADPETLVTLKQVNANFEIEMKRLDIDLERISAGDRASARDMAPKVGIWPHILLSTLFVCGFIIVLNLMFNGEQSVHENMMQPAMYVLGILSAGILQIMNFWFGSSSGSKEKTGIMGAAKK